MCIQNLWRSKSDKYHAFVVGTLFVRCPVFRDATFCTHIVPFWRHWRTKRKRSGKTGKTGADWYSLLIQIIFNGNVRCVRCGTHSYCRCISSWLWLSCTPVPVFRFFSSFDSYFIASQSFLVFMLLASVFRYRIPYERVKTYISYVGICEKFQMKQMHGDGDGCLAAC